MVKTIGAGIFLIGVLALLYAYTSGSDLGFVNFEPVEAGGERSIPILEVALSAIAMLIGAAFGVVHEDLGAAGTQTQPWRSALRALQSAAFLRALIASPLIFSAVYVAAQKQPDPVISLIFAFENGFFCNALVRERRPPT
jgi:hypothetical protein